VLFVDTALAARIERAECRLVADGAEGVRRRRPGTDVLVRPIAGGLAAFAVDGSPLNKIVGLGFAGEPDEAELAGIERAFAARKAPVQVEVSSFADPSVALTLSRRGYALVGIENVLGRALRTAGAEAGGTRAGAAGADLGTASRASPTATSGSGEVDVSPSGPEELDTWIDVVVTAFLHPDVQGVPSHESFPRSVLEDAIGDMAASDGFQRYLARRGGEPAGGASMRTFEGVAQLCGAGTLPEHRRRGVQSALLATRLALAAQAGCDVAVVTTQPGSKSSENVQRQGFELLYVRSILVREP
jgi:GNAT superfamily N-acetyltransferase